MRTLRICLVATAVLSFQVAGGEVGRPSDTIGNCRTELYRGFDRRLAVSVAGTFPTSNDDPVGFVEWKDKIVVAYSHRILATRTVGESGILPTFKSVGFLLSTPTGISVVASGMLMRFAENGLESVKAPEFGKDSIVAQNGTGSALLAVQNVSRVEFTARTASGTDIPLFSISGKLGRVSWTKSGFAAIVDDSLFTLETGTSKLEATPRDASFESATDLCMVGPSRAVVMYPHTAVLYSHGSRTVIAAVSRGRCAWDGQTLHLFDKSLGVAWKVENLNAVGDPESTRAFLARLTDEAKSESTSGNLAYRELARFMGIDRASVLTGRENLCSLPIH